VALPAKPVAISGLMRTSAGPLFSTKTTSDYAFAMSKNFLPDNGFVDTIGSEAEPWKGIWALELRAKGKKVVTYPISADQITGGELDPTVITELLQSTVIRDSNKPPRTITGTIALISGPTNMQLFDTAGGFLFTDVGKKIKITGTPTYEGTIVGFFATNQVTAEPLVPALASTGLTAEIAPPLRTIGDIMDQAALGAIDPVIRINASPDSIDGGVLRDESIPLDKLSPLIENALTHPVFVGAGGVIQSSDFGTNGTGFMLSQGGEVEFRGGQFNGLHSGTINIADFFVVDQFGSLVVGAPDPARILYLFHDGLAAWGGTRSFPFKGYFGVDSHGQAALKFRSGSNSIIDLDAIDTNVADVFVSSAGGQMTFQTSTRFGQVWYTNNGSDPTNFSNPNRILFDGVNIILVSGVTYKIVGYKLGQFGAVNSWTYDPTQCVPPVFAQLPGIYHTTSGTLNLVVFSSNAGGTIKYTKDGTNPSASNGTVMVGSIPLTAGSTNLKVVVIRPGFGDSPIIQGLYSLILSDITATPTGSGWGGGNDGSGGAGGHIPPPV
jgi:Chitobiase/beta-hexosaminidase C-terminal domain